MTVYRDGDLRALGLNTHGGRSIRNGTLGSLLDRFNPNLLYLQEIRPRDKDDLRKAIGPAWMVHGPRDSVVCLRLPRFVVLKKKAPEITYGGKHPRFATGALAVDVRTGRRLSTQSVHVQPLGKGLSGASDGARKRQTRQLRQYVKWQENRGRNVVCLDEGDFNQDLRDRPESLRPAIRPHSVYSLYEEADMFGVHELAGVQPARLDGFMLRPAPFIRIKRHRVIPTTRPGDNHPAVLTVLRVKALK